MGQRQMIQPVEEQVANAFAFDKGPVTVHAGQEGAQVSGDRALEMEQLVASKCLRRDAKKRPDPALQGNGIDPRGRRPIDRDVVPVAKGQERRHVRLGRLLEPPKRRRQASPRIVAAMIAPQRFRQFIAGDVSMPMRDQIAQNRSARTRDRQAPAPAAGNRQAPEIVQAKTRHTRASPRLSVARARNATNDNLRNYNLTEYESELAISRGDHRLPLQRQLREGVAEDFVPTLWVAGIAFPRNERRLGIENSIFVPAIGVDEKSSKRAGNHVGPGALGRMPLEPEHQHARGGNLLERFEMDIVERSAQLGFEFSPNEIVEILAEVWKDGVVSDLLLKVDRQSLSQHAITIGKIDMHQLVQDVGFAHSNPVGGKIHASDLAFPLRPKRRRELVLSRHVDMQSWKRRREKPPLLRGPCVERLHLAGKKRLERLLLPRGDTRERNVNPLDLVLERKGSEALVPGRRASSRVGAVVLGQCQRHLPADS